MVDIETLEKFKYAKPFKPFQLELDDGRVIPILDPMTIGWAPEISTVTFPYKEDGIDWTRFEHVVAVRPWQPRRPGQKAS